MGGRGSPSKGALRLPRRPPAALPSFRQPSCTHPLPDISILESYPTHEFGFDIGLPNGPNELRELRQSVHQSIRSQVGSRFDHAYIGRTVAGTLKQVLEDDRRLGTILLGILGALALMHALIFAPPAYVDDAYISLHNAEVFLSGQPDPNYAGSPALSGATSAPHVVLLALLLLLLPAPWAAWAAGLVGTVLYELGVFRLARAVGAPGWLALLAALLALTPANLIYQLFNGLETSLALAGVVWALVALADPSYRSWLPWILGVLPFLRPELIVVAGLLGLYAVYLMWRESPSDFAVRFLKFGSQVVLSAAPWLILYSVETGSPIPATIGAKKSYFAEGCAPPAWKKGAVLVSLHRATRELGVWLAAVVLSLRTPIGRLLLLFAAVFFASYYINFPGALSHYELRYMYVLEPMLIWGLLSTLSDRLPAIRLLSRGLLLLVGLQAAFSVPRAMELSLGVRDFALHDLAGVADWAKEHLPEDSRVMVHDAGYFAYASDFELVDLVGLKTPKNAAIHRDITLASCGRRRPAAISLIAEQGEASHFVLLAGWDRAFGITQGLEQQGWQPVLLRDGGQHGYHVLELQRSPTDHAARPTRM